MGCCAKLTHVRGERGRTFSSCDLPPSGLQVCLSENDVRPPNEDISMPFYICGALIGKVH